MSLPNLLPATSAFIQRAPSMLIGGDWVEAADGQTMPLHNPATGEVLCVVPRATPEDIDRAVLAARQAFDDSAWTRTRPRERQNLLWKLADLMQRDAELLAQLECLNNGKSAAVAQVMDVQLAIDFLRYMAGWATKIEGSTVDVSAPLMPNDQFHSFIRREAVGVVGAIVAWNFPLLLACWKLGPALATGCTVVLKPADETPLTALKLAELVLEAGYPEGVFNVVTGTGITAGSALTHNPLVDKLTFTGSTAVGKQIGKIAMDSMTRVTLELGGKSPTIVIGRRRPENRRGRGRQRDLLQPGPGLLRRFQAVCAAQAFRQCGGGHRWHRQRHETRQRPGPERRHGAVDLGAPAGARLRLHRKGPGKRRDHRLRW